MKKIDLGKEKINKLILLFAIPCVISMLINSVYNIVDQIFIGKGVGIIGNAATNVIFPVVIICNALAGLVGNGAAANLSLRLGEGKKDEARKKVMKLSEKYKLKIDPDALISDISVGMQQRVEILKMLFRDNNILIFDIRTY